jgi:hypothetical protein
MWVGITLSYQIPSLPPGSAIIGVASAVYLAAFIATALAGSRAGDRPRGENRRAHPPRLYSATAAHRQPSQEKGRT